MKVIFMQDISPKTETCLLVWNTLPGNFTPNAANEELKVEGSHLKNSVHILGHEDIAFELETQKMGGGRN